MLYKSSADRINQAYAASSFWESNTTLSPRQRLNKTAATLLGAGLGAVTGGLGAAATDNSVLGGAVLGAGVGAGVGKGMQSLNKAKAISKVQDPAKQLATKAGKPQSTTIHLEGGSQSNPLGPAGETYGQKYVHSNVENRASAIDEAINAQERGGFLGSADRVMSNHRLSNFEGQSRLAGQRGDIAQRLEGMAGAAQSSAGLASPATLEAAQKLGLPSAASAAELKVLRFHPEFAKLPAETQAAIKMDFVNAKRLEASGEIFAAAERQGAVHKLNAKVASMPYTLGGALVGGGAGYLSSSEKSSTRERLLRGLVGAGIGGGLGYGAGKLMAPAAEVASKSTSTVETLIADLEKLVAEGKANQTDKDVLQRLKAMRNQTKTASAAGVAIGATSGAVFGAARARSMHRKAPGQSKSRALYEAERDLKDLEARRKAGIRVSTLESKLNQIKLREARRAELDPDRAVAMYAGIGALTGAAAGAYATKGV